MTEKRKISSEQSQDIHIIYPWRRLILEFSFKYKKWLRNGLIGL